MSAPRIFAFASLLVGLLSVQVPLRGVTITGLVETSTSLTFSFSGFGDGDFIGAALPTLNYWSFGAETHSTNTINGTYGISFQVQHVGPGVPPGGQLVTIGSLNAITPFGTTFTDSPTVPHLDEEPPAPKPSPHAEYYLFDITSFYNQPGPSLWGNFEGSFSAVHKSVPDSGSVIVLLGISLLSVFGLHRRIHSVGSSH
jgi:hypothetical protein